MSETNTTAAQPASGSAATTAPPKAAPKPQNPALRMLGLPNLPKKLPSRNWMIFFAVTGAISSAIIYDKREKNRATAKWRRAVAPLARELLPDAGQLPRRLTIYIESPPGDGLRVAQDHFIEYVKPVLAASGLDWEFVQARQQGDTRAALAARIRIARMARERPGEEPPLTDDTLIESIRKSKNMPPYEGVKGDVVIGRHTWKEYVRGLHEGWLGPLDPPAAPAAAAAPVAVEEKPITLEDDAADAKKESEEKKKEAEPEEKKPARPPQPVPHNTPDDYQTASLPPQIPDEFAPSTQIPFPHRLGFRHTLVRLGWFFNRRKLADDIGREVAAVCYAAAREYRAVDGRCEQQLALEHEEKDWVKSVWKEKDEQGAHKPEDGAAGPAKELVWASPIVLDERIAGRMRRFEATAELEARAAEVVVPEEEIEGWIKGSVRSLWRWGASSFAEKPKIPNVGDLNEER